MNHLLKVMEEYKEKAMNDFPGNEVWSKKFKEAYNADKISIPTGTVIIQMLMDLWCELEKKRNLILEKLNVDGLPEEEGKEMPEGFGGHIYRQNLTLMANEYASIMDSIIISLNGFNQ